MRTRHWLTALTSGCMALAGIGTAVAQQPPLSTNGNPDQLGLGMLPPPYTTNYGPMQPGAASVNPAGMPPGANPWPGVSPYYGPQFNQTIYENGFWWNRLKGGDRKYYGSVEAIFSNTSVPARSLIGAPNVNPLSNDPSIRYAGQSSSSSGSTSSSGSSSSSSVTSTISSVTFNGTTTTYTSQTTEFNQSPAGTGPIISSGSSSTSSSSSSSSSSTGTSSTGTTGTGTSGSSGSGSTTLNLFPTFDTGVLPNVLNSVGFRGTWGWDNPDGTGFVASGFVQSQASSTWMLSDSLLNLNIDSPNYDPYHLHAWFGLPLAGADTDGTTAGTISDGAVVPYDMTVRINFTSALAGANADWYFEPAYDQGLIKIRPTAGGKFINLREGFLFDGYDSGMGYTVSSGSSSTSSSGSSSSSSSSSSSGSSSSSTGGYLSPSGFQTGFDVPNIIHSQLSSTTLSNMGGPELGFRVDLGGKKFQVWTQTKGGALANVSQRTVSGFGIGNAFNITSGNSLPAMPNDPNLTMFNHTYTSTTMSPMFEQQINAKLPIFNLVPYLRHIEFFERAQLTIGYTFLYIGNVYRPNSDIVWNQTVVNTTTTTNSTTGVSSQSSTVGVSPTLNSHMSSYFNNMLNFGIEWQY
jgi:hypothetical protein